MVSSLVRPVVQIRYDRVLYYVVFRLNSFIILLRGECIWNKMNLFSIKLLCIYWLIIFSFKSDVLFYESHICVITHDLVFHSNAIFSTALEFNLKCMNFLKGTIAIHIQFSLLEQDYQSLSTVWRNKLYRLKPKARANAIGYLFQQTKHCWIYHCLSEFTTNSVGFIQNVHQNKILYIQNAEIYIHFWKILIEINSNLLQDQIHSL